MILFSSLWDDFCCYLFVFDGSHSVSVLLLWDVPLIFVLHLYTDQGLNALPACLIFHCTFAWDAVHEILWFLYLISWFQLVNMVVVGTPKFFFS
jgi:hypothetical protein